MSVPPQIVPPRPLLPQAGDPADDPVDDLEFDMGGNFDGSNADNRNQGTERDQEQLQRHTQEAEATEAEGEAGGDMDFNDLVQRGVAIQGDTGEGRPDDAPNNGREDCDEERPPNGNSSTLSSSPLKHQPFTLSSSPVHQSTSEKRGSAPDSGADADTCDRRYVTAKDFELLSVIGMGSFGKVLQVRHRVSGRISAMKVISKRLLKKKNFIKEIAAERDIMTRVKHPFIVQMQCSFQTPDKLFLVMDFLAGGELFFHLGKQGILLERDIRFYVGEITLALSHLHSVGVVHRDLKPENVLLDHEGHTCLTDFGLAKEFDLSDDGRLRTVCGTSQYMSPEMIARKGYGAASDWWSLGCIVYEMMTGEPPFKVGRGEGAKELNKKILYERVKMPTGSSAEAVKLIKGLLNRDVSKRLGSAKSTMFEVGGVAQLKSMSFFDELDWILLEKKMIPPPFDLAVDGEEDLRNFHEEFRNMPLPRSVSRMANEDFKPRRCASDTFRGFSFINDSMVIPNRDDKEEEDYWKSAEVDRDSESEAASDMGEVVDQQSLKKKRPPRNKKKKEQKAREQEEAKRKEEEEKMKRKEEFEKAEREYAEKFGNIANQGDSEHHEPEKQRTAQPVNIDTTFDEVESHVTNSTPGSLSLRAKTPVFMQTKDEATNTTPAKQPWRPKTGGWAERAKKGGNNVPPVGAAPVIPSGGWSRVVPNIQSTSSSLSPDAGDFKPGGFARNEKAAWGATRPVQNGGTSGLGLALAQPALAQPAPSPVAPAPAPGSWAARIKAASSAPQDRPAPAPTPPLKKELPKPATPWLNVTRK